MFDPRETYDKYVEWNELSDRIAKAARENAVTRNSLAKAFLDEVEVPHSAMPSTYWDLPAALANVWFFDDDGALIRLPWSFINATHDQLRVIVGEEVDAAVKGWKLRGMQP